MQNDCSRFIWRIGIRRLPSRKMVHWTSWRANGLYRSLNLHLHFAREETGLEICCSCLLFSLCSNEHIGSISRPAHHRNLGSKSGAILLDVSPNGRVLFSGTEFTSFHSCPLICSSLIQHTILTPSVQMQLGGRAGSNERLDGMQALVTCFAKFLSQVALQTVHVPLHPFSLRPLDHDLQLSTTQMTSGYTPVAPFFIWGN